MKVEVSEAGNNKYPYVAQGKNTGLVVLMTGQSRGIIIEPGNSIREVGELCITMKEADLTPCSVTITNE